MWMGGGVRYCVAFACKVVETVLAIPIPIPSLFCVAFACKVVESVLAIPIPIPSQFSRFSLVKQMNLELATDPDPYHILIFVIFLMCMIFLSKTYES